MTGRKFNRLVVTGRTEYRKKRKVWECRCECGGTAWVASTQIRLERPKSCGCWQREVMRRLNQARRNKPLKEVVKYKAAHTRVLNLRGRAAQHACVDCSGQAYDWSYNGRDPNELTQEVDGYLMTYSPNPAYYEARCRLCHRAFDLKKKTNREKARP